MESAEKKNLITREDLLRQLDVLSDDIDNLFENPPANCILEKEVDKKVIELIEKLLEQKEFFQKVYRTSNGSFYFVLSDGSSIRFKFIKEKNGLNKYEPQNLMDETMFISQEEYDSIKESGFQYKLHESGFSVGSIPFEVSRKKEGEPILVSVGDNEFKINEQDLDRYHFGHPISEILKT